MERKYNRKVMIAKKPMHSHNRGPNYERIKQYDNWIEKYRRGYEEVI